METKEAVTCLSALAQPTRLSIFRHLVWCGKAGSSAGEISDTLKIPKPTLSFHLKELAHSDLIQSDREGRSIIYSLNPDEMSKLLHFLTEDCCQGKPELCLPKNNCC